MQTFIYYTGLVTLILILLFIINCIVFTILINRFNIDFKMSNWILWGNKLFRIELYLFQRGRYELGLTYDLNGSELFSINFIFIHVEIQKEYEEETPYIY